jgi:hypothetical protein
VQTERQERPSSIRWDTGYAFTWYRLVCLGKAERDAILKDKKSTHLNADKIKMLAKLKAFYREFANRRQLGVAATRWRLRCTGVLPMP